MALIEETTRLIISVMKIDGITRTELARRMGVSKSHISRLLDGKRNMRLSTIEEIMAALEVEPHMIYIWKGDKGA